MPTLSWLTRDKDLRAADRVPYRLLDGVPELSHGDFNQRIPRGTQPVKAFEALQGALAPRFVVATAGVTDSRGRAAIDHLAHTPDLVAAVRGELPSRESEGPRLSDHFGLVVDIQKVDLIR